MEAYIPLLIFFLISIGFSFLCSIWEAVLLSITPSWTEQKLKEGGKVGQLLKKFKSNIDRPLSAILTLNTIAHTLGAMGVGAQAEKIWASDTGLEIGGIFIGANAIVGTVMTLAILILSEIIPKTLGANYWRQLTSFTVLSLNVIIKLLLPLVWISQQITKLLKKDKERSVFSRADFTAMAELGAKEGVFEKNEGSIIQNLLKFNRITAKDVMTPRTVVRMADRDQSIKDYYDSRK
ncbi:MAG: CNNM domain-containing protein [Bacteroidota bacterium]